MRLRYHQSVPRAKVGLTPSEYAVLGLLTAGPDYGYRLQQHFSGGQGLARVCPIDSSMVYAILKSLSGLELIDGTWDSSQYPPRAVYAIRPEGEAAFERWLRAPIRRVREVRSEFLIKLYFALRRGDEALAASLVEQQAAACAKIAQQHEAELAGVDPDSFDAIVIGSKLSAARLTEEWLQEVRKKLRLAKAAP